MTEQTLFGNTVTNQFDDAISLKHEQVVLGHIPSKSNSYVIIRIKNPKPGARGIFFSKTDKLRKYEKDFILQAGYYRNKMIEGPFSLSVDVYFPNVRCDLDGIFKVLLDCLQEVKAFENDNKCVHIEANKHVDKNNPRVEFTLKKA